MMKKTSSLTFLLIIIVGLLTVSPVIMLTFGSFSKGLSAFGTFTLEKYISAYTDPAFAKIIFNTIIFVIGSSMVATLLALFLAYLNNRTNIPFKFIFKIISITPMMIPHILFSVSWVLLLNPSNGILNLILKQLFSLESSPLNIYSLWGMIMVEGLLDMPIAYLIIAPAMASFDVNLEESSRVFGANTGQTLFRITLPVLRPAILASFILCIVRCMASFAVPSVIGMPGRIYVLATHIYRTISIGFAVDYGKAAAIGMSVLVTSVTLIYLYRYLTSESEKYVTISSRGYRPTVIELKKAKIPLFFILGFLLFILIVLPVLVLIYTSLVPYSMVPSARAFSM
ncbi:MAG: ABC transporter permease, partial [Atribacterota bacterium]